MTQKEGQADDLQEALPIEKLNMVEYFEDTFRCLNLHPVVQWVSTIIFWLLFLLDVVMPFIYGSLEETPNFTLIDFLSVLNSFTLEHDQQEVYSFALTIAILLLCTFIFAFIGSMVLEPLGVSFYITPNTIYALVIFPCLHFTVINAMHRAYQYINVEGISFLFIVSIIIEIFYFASLACFCLLYPISVIMLVNPLLQRNINYGVLFYLFFSYTSIIGSPIFASYRAANILNIIVAILFFVVFLLYPVFYSRVQNSFLQSVVICLLTTSFCIIFNKKELGLYLIILAILLGFFIGFVFHPYILPKIKKDHYACFYAYLRRDYDTMKHCFDNPAKFKKFPAILEEMIKIAYDVKYNNIKHLMHTFISVNSYNMHELFVICFIQNDEIAKQNQLPLFPVTHAAELKGYIEQLEKSFWEAAWSSELHKMPVLSAEIGTCKYKYNQYFLHYTTLFKECKDFPYDKYDDDDGKQKNSLLPNLKVFLVIAHILLLLLVSCLGGSFYATHIHSRSLEYLLDTQTLISLYGRYEMSVWNQFHFPEVSRDIPNTDLKEPPKELTLQKKLKEKKKAILSRKFLLENKKNTFQMRRVHKQQTTQQKSNYFSKKSNSTKYHEHLFRTKGVLEDQTTEQILEELKQEYQRFAVEKWPEALNRTNFLYVVNDRGTTFAETFERLFDEFDINNPNYEYFHNCSHAINYIIDNLDTYITTLSSSKQDFIFNFLLYYQIGVMVLLLIVIFIYLMVLQSRISSYFDQFRLIEKDAYLELGGFQPQFNIKNSFSLDDKQFSQQGSCSDYTYTFLFFVIFIIIDVFAFWIVESSRERVHDLIEEFTTDIKSFKLIEKANINIGDSIFYEIEGDHDNFISTLQQSDRILVEATSDPIYSKYLSVINVSLFYDIFGTSIYTPSVPVNIDMFNDLVNQFIAEMRKNVNIYSFYFNFNVGQLIYYLACVFILYFFFFCFFYQMIPFVYFETSEAYKLLEDAKAMISDQSDIEELLNNSTDIIVNESEISLDTLNIDLFTIDKDLNIIYSNNKAQKDFKLKKNTILNQSGLPLNIVAQINQVIGQIKNSLDPIFIQAPEQGYCFGICPYFSVNDKALYLHHIVIIKVKDHKHVLDEINYNIEIISETAYPKFTDAPPSPSASTSSLNSASTGVPSSFSPKLHSLNPDTDSTDDIPHYNYELQEETIYQPTTKLNLLLCIELSNYNDWIDSIDVNTATEIRSRLTKIANSLFKENPDYCRIYEDSKTLFITLPPHHKQSIWTFHQTLAAFAYKFVDTLKIELAKYTKDVEIRVLIYKFTNDVIVANSKMPLSYLSFGTDIIFKAWERVKFCIPDVVCFTNDKNQPKNKQALLLSSLISQYTTCRNETFELYAIAV